MSFNKNYFIHEHRKMWTWIAEQYEQGSNDLVTELKKAYLSIYPPESYVINHCYLCTYAGYSTDVESTCITDCSRCPVEWTGSYLSKCMCCDATSKGDTEGLYGQLCKICINPYISGEVKSNLAYQIANLPEREV